MNDDVWGKLLIVVAPPLIAVFIGAIRSIANNAPSPTRRKYWAGELPVRIELASAKELKSGLKERLSSRAEMALEYLDADEAVRRARSTGPAPVWVMAISAYIFGIGISMQIGFGTFHPILIVVALIFVAVGVWAQLLATQMPGRRRELIRVLVEIQSMAGGYSMLLKSPEVLVSLWNRYRRPLRKRAANKCLRTSKVVTYDSYADELLKLNAIYGRLIRLKSRNRRYI